MSSILSSKIIIDYIGLPKNLFSLFLSSLTLEYLCPPTPSTDHSSTQYSLLVSPPEILNLQLAVAFTRKTMDTSAWAACHSEYCPTRLIQCRQVGILMNDVSRKFEKDPKDAPDLSPEDFLARRKIINQVAWWRIENEDRKWLNEWIPFIHV
jgi:hypothetical protein